MAFGIMPPEKLAEDLDPAVRARDGDDRAAALREHTPHLLEEGERRRQVLEELKAENAVELRVAGGQAPRHVRLADVEGLSRPPYPRFPRSDRAPCTRRPPGR